jgi:hypothetical protein
MTEREQGLVPVTQPAAIGATVDRFSTGLERYLQELGLPSEGVLVAPGERMRVLNNLPELAADLPAEYLGRAYYMSKFVSACSVGLFDAALNFLWNETISNLRQKVARFDLDYFLDSLITDSKRRSKFNSADDLDELEDWELIQGCLKTGIISEIGFKHLDFIRDIRNHASAAHPNENPLTGFQVLAWLETCIREVLAKEPEGGVIEVRKLLQSLRNETLGQHDVDPIADSLQRLQADLVRSLFRAIFGMFTDTGMAASTRNNILLIAVPLWTVTPEDSRYEAGIKHETLAVNGEVARGSLAHQFLEFVHGLSYLPATALAGEINRALEALSLAHNGFNNFHNEPAHAKVLAGLVPNTGRLPRSIEHEYVKVLTMCRIGNGYGVSIGALSIYDSLIGKWSERHVLVLLGIVRDDKEVSSRLQFPLAAGNLRTLAGVLKDRTANTLVQRALAIIAETPVDQVSRLAGRAEYSQALEDIARR